MFGFERKAQGLEGSKFGFAEVWHMFSLICAELCSTFGILGDVRCSWVMNSSSRGSKFGIFGFGPALLCMLHRCDG